MRITRLVQLLIGSAQNTITKSSIIYTYHEHNSLGQIKLKHERD